MYKFFNIVINFTMYVARYIARISLVYNIIVYLDNAQYIKETI